ncbi:MAG: UvrD-helicase domain-containing protein [Pseudomonadota bacterium]
MTGPETKWTEKQSQALAFEANLCVLAGAGSGKTMTLVELLLRLLEGRIPGFKKGLDLGEVLALTYTEKAAREMRDRVRLALNRKIREADPGTESLWRKQRRRLDQAQITTIHGFCLQLLRARGLEAGLDPDFYILDEERDFQDEFIRNLLLDWLQEGRSDLLDLLDYFPWLSRGRSWGVDSLLTQVLGRSRTFGRRQVPEDGPGVDIAGLIEAVADSARMINELIQAKRVPLGKEYGRRAKAFSLKALELSAGGLSGEEILARAAELRSDIKGNWYAAKAPKDNALAALELLAGERARRLAKPLKARIFRLAEALAEELDRAKERRKALDFDDLLLKTKQLLAENIKARAEIKQRFQVVLIDEFQDANRLQADILAFLCEPEGREDRLGPDASPFEDLARAARRLVVFGDPKQSIYRFRGAEVNVYGKLRDSILGNGGRLTPLDKNFRSQGRLVRFFNSFFPEIMKPGEDFESEYGPNDRQTWHRPDLGPGPAAFLLDLPPVEGAAPAREREALALADYLARLFGGGEGVVIGAGRTPTPGDVAVLLRRFTHLKVYEEAFRRAGLPFYTVRGKGFYQCQEVWDLIDLIFFLADPTHGPALLGVLRSPLFGISDEVLTRLAWPSPGTPQPLASYFVPGAGDLDWPPDLGEEDLAPLGQAREILRWLSRRAGRTFPAELIEAAVEKTQFLAVLLAQSQGARKAANVQGFIELTRTLPLNSLSAPGELSRFLLRRLADSQDDPEAQVSAEGADAVRIMTIHQAKGLQFPVVLVPDVGQKHRADPGPLLFGNRDSFALKFKDPAAGESLRPGDYALFQEQDLIRERAEYLRLLYVAATRAEDLLVFSGTSARSGEDDFWLGLLRGFAENNGDILGVIQVMDEERPPSATACSHNNLDPSRLEPLPASAPTREILHRVLDRPTPRPSEITINVTDLTHFLQCPRAFYFETLLGAPPEKPFNLEREAETGPSPREKGLVFHYLLETLELKTKPDHQRLTARGLEWARGEGWNFNEKTAAEISGSVLDFLAGEWGRDLLAHPEMMVQRECPVWLKVESRAGDVPALIITGEIDLFYLKPDGSIRLVDYKFASPREAGRYEPQVKTYALALNRAGLAREMEAGLWFAGAGAGRAVAIPLRPGWIDQFEADLNAAAGRLAGIMRPDAQAPEIPRPCPNPACGLKYLCRTEGDQGAS